METKPLSALTLNPMTAFRGQIHTETLSPPKKRAKTQPDGRKGVLIRLEPAEHKALKRLAVEMDTTIQDLLAKQVRDSVTPRPPVPKRLNGQARLSENINVCVTIDTMKAVVEAARREGVNIAEFGRRALASALAKV
jgi:hypothetical protein